MRTPWAWLAVASLAALGLTAGVSWHLARHRGEPGRAAGEPAQREPAEPPRSPGVLLTGQVVDDQGEPVAEATLQAAPPGGEGQAWRVRSDASGHFTLRLPEAHYDLDVSAPLHERTVLRDVRAPSRQPLRIVLGAVAALEGVTLDAEGRPLAQAQVKVAGTGLWPPQVRRSSADGRFRFEALPAGVYEVHAAHDALVSAPVEGLVLTPRQVAEVRLTLQPGQRLKGCVRDALRREPVLDARVQLSEHALGFTPTQMTTDADGCFETPPLRAVPHRLSVSAPGYVAEPARTVVPGRDDAVQVELMRAAQLAGTVVSPTGHPVSGAALQILGTDFRGDPLRLDGSGAALDGQAPQLSLQPSGDLGVTQGPVPLVPAPIWRADGELSPVAPTPATDAWRTDGSGRFHLAALPPGELRVVAFHPSYAPASSEPRRVAPGAHVDTLRVQLVAAGSLEGRVVDGQGHPQPVVRVEIEAARELGSRSLLADADGRFDVQGLVGDVTVTAYPIGRPPVRVRTAIEAGEHQQVELRLADGSMQLEGRVLDERGFPLEGAVVTVTSLEEAVPFRAAAASHADGRFRFEGLPAPPYAVEAQHPDYPTARIPEWSSDAEALHIEMRPGGQLRGQVMDRWSAEPVAAVQVRLKGPRRLSATTSSEGRFAFPRLIPGEYTLMVDSQAHRPWRETVQVTAGGAPQTLDTLWLEPTGRVAGTVVDALGAPVPGAKVCGRADPDAEGCSATDTTDGGGRFVLTRLAESDVRITATHPHAGRSDGSAEVRVYPRQETPGVVLHLEGRAD